jgi:hypothetical protein
LKPPRQTGAAKNYLTRLLGITAEEPKSLIEANHALEGKKISTAMALRLLADFHFCPDTFMSMLYRTSSIGAWLILISFTLREKSYFWLFESYNYASQNGFHRIAKILRWRCLRAASQTSLPIVNFPIKWEGSARELLPEMVIEKLRRV